jgi:hypothetical protein
MRACTWTGAAALLALIAAAPAAPAQDHVPDPPSPATRRIGAADDAAQSGSTRPVPWPAPKGHRQPRAADIPPVPPPKTGTDEALERLQRQFDGRLTICRGC